MTTDAEQAEVAPVHRRRGRLGVICAGGALLAVIVLVAVFLAAGGRWYTVTTPSMGQAAPVGTLLLTKPADPATLRVGDIAVVRPPGNDASYAHRIAEITYSNGQARYQTKGDINNAVDAWELSADDITGVVIVNWYTGGFILRGLPYLLLGFVAVWLLTHHLVARNWRTQVRIMGYAAIFTITCHIVRPFLGAQLLHSAPDNNGHMQMTVVSTGILPIKVTEPGGSALYLTSSGQVGTLTVPTANDKGQFLAYPSTHLTWPWWLAIIAVCLLPLILLLIFGLAPNEQHRYRSQTPAVAAVGAFLALYMVATTGGLPQAQAAFTARVHNARNAANSAMYFNCQAYLDPDGPPSPTVAYMLNESQGETSATDISGNSPHGEYNGAYSGTVGKTQVSDRPCARDAFSATIFDGRSAVVLTPYLSVPPQAQFTLSLWFRTDTPSTTSAELIGFFMDDGSNDRKIYLDRNGHVVFGVFPNKKVQVIRTWSKNYRDGQWHQVVATQSKLGMRLYVDGHLQAASAAVTGAEEELPTAKGRWRIGSGMANGWPDMDSNHFNGAIAMVAIYYQYSLNEEQILAQYQAGR